MEETKKSLWTNGLLAFITIPIFYGMGTVLYSFYAHNGGVPHGMTTSAIVPYFIVTKMPAEVAGLIIAAIFAAAQSTIASSLNAISSCFVTDIKQRFFGKKRWAVSDVNLARVIIAVSGLFSLSIAIYLLAGNASGTWDLFLMITGLFGVPVAGIFAAGIFTHAANGVSSVTGLIVSAIVTWIVDQTSTSPFIISSISFLVAFFVAWLIGLITPKFGKNVDGLTAKTIKMEYKQPK